MGGGGDEDAAMAVDGDAAIGPATAEVHKFLRGIGLSRYLDKLVAAGFDSMDALRAMEEEDMKQDCGMLPGHIRLLQKHLAKTGGAPRAPARARPSGASGRSLGGPSPQQLAATASLSALAASTFGSEAAGSSVADLLARASSELQQLRPAAAAAAERAAKRGPEPERPRPPKTPKLPSGPTDEASRKARQEQEEAKQLELARNELAPQYDERLRSAMHMAQVQMHSEPDPPGADDTLAALAQLAEGSAQLVATAASFCANPQVDSSVLLAVIEAAQQGAQRASWAAVTAVAYGDNEDFDKDWHPKMRRAAVQASEVAEQYARDCASAVKMVGKSKAVEKTFCAFHVENRCMKGASCEFSHDAAVLQPVPPIGKIELECCFFPTGQCSRGAGCPFAHGKAELDEILRLKTAAAPA